MCQHQELPAEGQTDLLSVRNLGPGNRGSGDSGSVMDSLVLHEDKEHRSRLPRETRKQTGLMRTANQGL